MSIFIEELVEEYKRNNAIKEMGYSKKIKSKFLELDKKIIDQAGRRICALNYVNFSNIIYKNFKKHPIEFQKNRLSNLIKIRLKKSIDIKFETKRKNNEFSGTYTKNSIKVF
jgi:Fe2+ transport system protein B